MKRSKIPLWKKSMLQFLNLGDISECLWEIVENGDMYGYDREESEYYQEYKEQFDELSACAYSLSEALNEYDIQENWNDMTVALLGYQQTVLGYDFEEADYFRMLDPFDEDFAAEEAEKRLLRLNKHDLIRIFRKVMVTLVLFFDIKAAHDCLTSIVEELDYRGAVLEEKNNQINLLYTDLTGKSAEIIDSLVSQLPQRMWVE